MAGFVYGAGRTVQPQANARANISMAAPYYGNGLHYNCGVQKIEGVTRHFGNFNGIGVAGNACSQPVQVPHQMYYYKPYGVTGNANNNNGSGGWMQVGPNPNPSPYYKSNATEIQAIQGDIVQRGTFNGRGIGARIHGHLSVSGDIN